MAKTVYAKPNMVLKYLIANKKQICCMELFQISSCRLRQQERVADSFYVNYILGHQMPLNPSDFSNPFYQIKNKRSQSIPVDRESLKSLFPSAIDAKFQRLG